MRGVSDFTKGVILMAVLLVTYDLNKEGKSKVDASLLKRLSDAIAEYRKTAAPTPRSKR